MSYNVLIVDDSAVMRRMIRRALSLSGVGIGDVNEAGDGEQAIAFMRAHWVDLVLTDINMPHMGGVSMVEEMQKDDDMAAIPVVVITSDKSQAHVDRARAMGVKGYLLKPFKPDDLRAMVEKALRDVG